MGMVKSKKKKSKVGAAKEKPAPKTKVLKKKRALARQVAAERKIPIGPILHSDTGQPLMATYLRCPTVGSVSIKWRKWRNSNLDKLTFQIRNTIVNTKFLSQFVPLGAKPFYRNKTFNRRLLGSMFHIRAVEDSHPDRPSTWNVQVNPDVFCSLPDLNRFMASVFKPWRPELCIVGGFDVKVDVQMSSTEANQITRFGKKRNSSTFDNQDALSRGTINGISAGQQKSQLKTYDKVRQLSRQSRAAKEAMRDVTMQRFEVRLGVQRIIPLFKNLSDLTMVGSSAYSNQGVSINYFQQFKFFDLRFNRSKIDLALDSVRERLLGALYVHRHVSLREAERILNQDGNASHLQKQGYFTRTGVQMNLDEALANDFWDYCIEADSEAATTPFEDKVNFMVRSFR